MLKVNIIFLFFASIFFTLASKTSYSQTSGVFKCTKLGNVNLRNGPGLKFNIAYKVLARGYPLKIIDTIDTWVAVEDFKGERVWVSSSNLSNKCGKIVNTEKAEVFLKPSTESGVILTLQEGFILNNINCYNRWCEVKIEDKKGWILSSQLWG
jgi:SH3-like domain-containing protein